MVEPALYFSRPSASSGKPRGNPSSRMGPTSRDTVPASGGPSGACASLSDGAPNSASAPGAQKRITLVNGFMA